MIGGGAYDEVAKAALKSAKAEAVLLVVVHGEHGDGITMHASTDILFALPALLRRMADQIETDAQRGPLRPWMN